MGPRNLLILFFSTVAVSLVILIIFFSLFFKNVDLNFNTRLPESAPDIGTLYGGNQDSGTLQSKAEGLLRSTVNVPPELKESATANASPAKKAETEPMDGELPPITDDAVLDENAPVVVDESGQPKMAPTSAPPAAGRTHSVSRQAPAVESAPMAEPDSSGPPVPPQGNAAPADAANNGNA